MMRISQQIGWSQESKLIFQLIQQTEKLNKQFPTGQPAFKIPVSKQIGWSNESNLYYEWLTSLSKLTSHYANCCTPTTTTTTTTIPPIDPGLTTAVANNSRFDIPADGDFTIEWLVKMTNDSPHPRVWSFGSWPSAAHAVSIENGQFYYWINGSIVLPIDINMYEYLGTWTHFCIMRSSGTIYVFMNGGEIGSVGISSAIPTLGYDLYLGSEGNDSIMNGLMSNFRWNNTAVYNPAGFIPPISPLTNISGTQLLIFQGNTLPLELTDNSGLGNVVVNNSGVYNIENPFVGVDGSMQFGTV